jgi:hypothetical protein
MRKSVWGDVTRWLTRGLKPKASQLGVMNRNPRERSMVKSLGKGGHTDEARMGIDVIEEA